MGYSFKTNSNSNCIAVYIKGDFGRIDYSFVHSPNQIEGLYLKLKYSTNHRLIVEKQDYQSLKYIFCHLESFFIIPYELFCIRPTIDSLLQAENYKSIRQKTIIIYVSALVTGYAFFKDTDMYTYLILVGDFLLLTDACLRMVAYRFWGRGSFVNNRWYNLVNLLVSLIVVASLASPLFDLFFLRVLRVFLLL